MSESISITSVREAERNDIVERRRMVGFPLPDGTKDPNSEVARTDLIGVAFSGGGQRSACFCLGVVQAMFKTGLWRFVDYLSTISGGGYLGGYVSSLVLKEQQVQTRENSQLMASSRTPQSPDVQRFIYGGYSLMRPWELFNKYLIGVVLLNASLFSAIVGICALVAFLWRCMDYPWVRERLALLDLGSDLQTPFWPFAIFAFLWLVAWMVSYFRRGAEAPGKFAKRLLFLTVGSLLVAITILLGNGDVATGFGMKVVGKEHPAAPHGVVAALIAMVVGGLLPFLRPKRLIESGLKPDKRPLEKIVFHIASTALLVGVPLVLIGIFSHENISGYNNHRHRPLIKEDIEDWRGLVSLYLPQNDENLTNGQQPFADRFRREVRSGTALEDVYAEDVQKALAAWPKDPRIHTVKTSSDDVVKMADAIYRHNRKLSEPIRSDLVPIPSLEELTSPKGADAFAQESALALAIRDVCQTETRYRDAFTSANEYRTFWLSHYIDRGFYFLGWIRGLRLTPSGLPDNEVTDRNPIAKLWRARIVKERLQDALCHYINARLRSDRLAESLVAQMNQLGDGPSSETSRSSSDESAAIDQPQLASLLQAAALSDVSTWNNAEKAELNRRILEEQFPLVFRDRNKVRRKVTVFEDQKVRLIYAGGALLFFLVAGMWIDMNATSLHYYYRNRIQQAFLIPQSAKAPAWALSKLHTTAYGAPYHLIAASVGSITQLVTRTEGGDYDQRNDPSDVQRKRVFPFLFSRKFCGSETTGYIKTEDYEGRVRGDMNQINLSEAIALSGAAVTPHNVQNALVAFLMLVLNLRLGQWIPNPRSCPPGTRPTVLYVLATLARQALTGRRSEDSWYRFVTDGGYSDNLGLLPLLERRCRLIIAVDAGCDPTHRFDDLAHVLRVARIHHGIRFLELSPNGGAWRPDSLQLRDATPSDTKKSGESETADGKQCRRIPSCLKHFSIARIQYPVPRPGEPPQPEQGLLIYIKPSINGDESLDVRQYQQQNQDFPHQSTSNQMYDQSQVEAYRQLGYHIAAEMCQLLPPLTSNDMQFWDDQFTKSLGTNQLCSWFAGGHAGWTTTSSTSDVQAATPIASTVEEGVAAEVAHDREREGSDQEFAEETKTENGAKETTTVGKDSKSLDLDDLPDDQLQESSRQQEWDAEKSRALCAEAFYFQPINVMEQPHAAMTEFANTQGMQTEWDEMALHECLGLEDLEKEFEQPSSKTRTMLLEGLRSHPIATTRVAIVDKLGELRRLPPDVRQLLLDVAKNDPHRLVRSRAEHTAKKRGRNPK